MSNLITNLTQLSTTSDPGIGFYSYVLNSSGLYLDTSTTTFVPLASAVTPKVPFSESPAGSGNWTWTLAVTTWPNGQYTINSFEASSNVPAAQPFQTYIFNGMPPADFAATFATLNQNTGGTGNLTYVGGSGIGISGALIQVFTQAAYNAGNLSSPLGITNTDINGNWIDSIQAPAGATYAVLFQLSGTYGPDVVYITV